MNLAFSPVLIASSVLGLGLCAAALVLWTVLGQPWIGMQLLPVDGGLQVVAVDPRGPAAGLIVPGTVVTGLGGAAGGHIALSPLDLIEEPDTLRDPAAIRDFFDRQDRIHARLSDGPVRLTLLRPDGAGMARTTVLTPAPSRPPGDLPGVFWIQIGVGLVGMVLCGWVLALRRGDRAVQFFVLAGVGLMISAFAAALYSTRELALAQPLFSIASKLNYLGTLTFGIGMINLFLIYPSRLAGPPLLWIVAALLSACILAVILDGPAFLLDRQLPVALAMLALLVAVVVQAAVNRRNPTARAMLGWFGLSVLLGAGGFGLTVTLPLLLGAAPSLSQGHAFLFFLAIFVGLAMGIARYRLFQLSDWSFRILFYLGGVLLLLALDAALIFVLGLERVPALSLSLALVGLVYLPMRDVIDRRLRRGRRPTSGELFALVGNVALAADDARRDAALEALLHRLFDPLRIEHEAPATGAARLTQGGEVLDMPLQHGLPAIRLHWARQGRRLFTRSDERLARSVTEMLDRSIARQRAHDAAVETERRRINRDMHDNIGVQLLGALHTRDTARKDMLIRQTLADLRQIVSAPAADRMLLSRLLADLRREIGDHLEAAGRDLAWEDGGLTAGTGPQHELAPILVQTLRAILRESVSNILRHSGARHVTVTLTRKVLPAGPVLKIVIEDDGPGHQAGRSVAGSGLTNLRDRVDGCGGLFRICTTPAGTRVEAVLPLQETAGEAGPARRAAG